MKLPAHSEIVYTSLLLVSRALDTYYSLVNEAFERRDRKMLQALYKSALEWHQSINNRRLNYDDPEITPIIRLNLGRAFYEAATLLKVIELKLVSVKR